MEQLVGGILHFAGCYQIATPLPRTTMAKHGLSTEEVEDLKEAFNMFDVDGGGKWLTAVPGISCVGIPLAILRQAQFSKQLEGSSAQSLSIDYYLITFTTKRNNYSLQICIKLPLCVYLSGSISQDELKGVMKKLGSNPTDEDIQQMIKSVDDNGDGEIDFEEFLILMSTKKKNEDPDKELMDAFKVFDADSSGTISRKELKKLMKQLGQKLSDQELDAMMEEIDTDKSGEIDFEEFKAMMQN